MAEKPSSNLAGIALMIIGLGSTYYTCDMLSSFDSQFSQAFSSTSSHAILIRNVTGALVLLLPLYLLKSKSV